MNETEIFKCKGVDNISPYQFCLGSVSKDFSNNKVALNGTLYDFSIQYGLTNVKDLLHAYLRFFFINTEMHSIVQ